MVRVCNPLTEKDIHVFLAGGISNCPDWQSEVIDRLKNDEFLKSMNNIVIDNPRREFFDVSQEDDVLLQSEKDQIEWEFDKLESCDIFSIYFCNSSSVQPICMYELGRNIVRMQEKFPHDWQIRIVISVEDGYIRKKDVLLQSELALGGLNVFVNQHATPESHSKYIVDAIRCLVE